MSDLIATLREAFGHPRRHRANLVVSAYCEVHGVDFRADGAGDDVASGATERCE